MVEKMKLDNFEQVKNYEAEKEKKELDFIINLTREALTDSEKEKEWNAVRTSFALYTEGKKGTYMMRPRYMESKITVDDMEYLLDVVEKYGDGRLHITTRQDFQLHGLKREVLADVLETISKRGFFTKATCGDSTRSVITPPTTGFEKEVFDVGIYSRIISDYILEGRHFMHLPRKYKIALSNKEENSLYVKINDLGFQAVIKDGKRGFRVYAGGGLGPISQHSIILREFIEEDEILYYVHAIKNLFADHGNRKIRARARLRYVLIKLGEEEFLKLCNEYIQNFYKEKGDELKIFVRNILDNERKNNENSVENENTEEENLEKFDDVNIVAGKNGKYGYYLRPVRGNIYKEDGLKFINFVRNLGYDVDIKITNDQRILVRGLEKEDMFKLKDLMDGYYNGNDFFNSYSCIGSTTCNVGIVDTPPILDYIFKYFEDEDKKELTNYLPQLRIAGCPNSCATPQIAKLGFSGRRKKDGEYFAIFAGGEFTGKTVKLNAIMGEIKADKVPYFLEDVAKAVKSEKIKFDEFVKDERFVNLIEKYKEFELESVDFGEFRKRDMERAW